MSENYNELLEMWRDEKQRKQFAEKELNNQNELKKTIDLKNEEIQNLDLKHKKDQDTIHQKTAKVLSLEQIVNLFKSDKQANNIIEKKHQTLNGKLQKRVTELEKDNKQLTVQVNDKIDQLRKAGL
jgi:hypothetical protein